MEIVELVTQISHLIRGLVNQIFKKIAESFLLLFLLTQQIDCQGSFINVKYPLKVKKECSFCQ